MFWFLLIHGKISISCCKRKIYNGGLDLKSRSTRAQQSAICYFIALLRGRQGDESKMGPRYKMTSSWLAHGAATILRNRRHCILRAKSSSCATKPELGSAIPRVCLMSLRAGAHVGGPTNCLGKETIQCWIHWLTKSIVTREFSCHRRNLAYRYEATLWSVGI